MMTKCFCQRAIKTSASQTDNNQYLKFVNLTVTEGTLDFCCAVTSSYNFLQKQRSQLCCTFLILDLKKTCFYKFGLPIALIKVNELTKLNSSKNDFLK